jgi:hypothetical protein
MALQGTIKDQAHNLAMTEPMMTQPTMLIFGVQIIIINVVFH